MADTIEKPVVDTDTGEATPEVKDVVTDPKQVEDLIAALQGAGVTNTDQLEGKLAASQQVGHMNNLLGEVRAENAKLVETIQNMQTTNPPAQQTVDYDNDTPGQQVDLDTLVARNVEKVLDKRDKQAAQMQNASLQKYHKITTDRNYSRVKAIWEEKLKDPQFTFEINNGIKDPVDAYREIVDDFKDGLLKQSLDTITSLTGSGQMPASPHIEGEAKVSHDLPVDKPESQETIDKLQAKVDKGQQLTEQEQLAALNATLFGPT
jgi:hypothetical protein